MEPLIGIYAPVYVNPALHGCYTPLTPGYKDSPLDTTFECDDPNPRLIGPGSGPRANYGVTALSNPLDAGLVHPPSILVPGRTWYYHACAQGIDLLTFLAGVLQPITPTVGSIEECALQCTNILSPVMNVFAVAGGGLVTVSPFL